MKILQIVSPVIPLPASTVGGIERVVEYLIDELVEQGHDVTFMGHSDSRLNPSIKFIPIGTYLNRKNIIMKVWIHILFNRYDVIHNHGRLIYFLPSVWNKTRKVHTFHMAELLTNSFSSFIKMRPVNLTLSPCAKWIEKKFKKQANIDWQFVNNGIPLKKYKLKKQPFNKDAPLVIICRIGLGKGVLDAIAIAKASNKNLIIAGKGGDYPHEREWFNNSFLPNCDGVQIKYVGELEDIDKQRILEKALALLMLSIDIEAFNLTMLEANACGCPVLSYNRFFPPDFIKPGVNGFIGDTQEDLIEKVKDLHLIDRDNCRKDFEQNYTSEIMAKNYLKLYKISV